MDKTQSIPKSEAAEVKGLNKYLYKAMDWLGLASGIEIIGIGAWWFIWCLFKLWWTIQFWSWCFLVSATSGRTSPEDVSVALLDGTERR